MNKCVSVFLALVATVALCSAHPHAPKGLSERLSELEMASAAGCCDCGGEPNNTNNNDQCVCCPGTDGTPIITGNGSFRYQYDPTRLVLPKSVQLLNAHGLAMSHVDGSIYFTYESVVSTKTQPQTRALIRFNADGTNATLLGKDNQLAQGVPHGIKLAVEDGVEYLYHANNDAIVTKTDLEGNVIWTRDMTSVWSKDASNWPFKPTDVLLPPGGKTVYVADGYGSSKVHGFDTKTGNYTGFVFGGAGTGTAPLQFHCDHGISYDTRVNQILVSDRANHRLVWIDEQGKFISTKAYPQVPLPCNAQTSNGTSLGGDYLIIPGLGESVSGSTFILDKNNNIISTLEVNKFLGATGSKHPHDAIFLSNGDVAVVCWAPG